MSLSQHIAFQFDKYQFFNIYLSKSSNYSSNAPSSSIYLVKVKVVKNEITQASKSSSKNLFRWFT